MSQVPQGRTQVLSVRLTSSEARRLRRAARRSPQRKLSPYLYALICAGERALDRTRADDLTEQLTR